MLLGILREGEGGGVKVLVAMGADLSRVRQGVIQALSGHQSAEGEAPPPPPLAAAEPSCPHCCSLLESGARSRRLEIDEHAMLVVYCGVCGRALAFRPLD